MRFPRSTSGGCESYGASVLGEVVRGVVLPAAPYDADPDVGENAHGVWLSFAARDGVAVDLCGPWADVSAVVGKVDEGVAEFPVGCPAEAQVAALAGGFDDGGDAGEHGETFFVEKAAAVVADFAEEAGGADAVAGFGQRGQDVLVGVGVEAVDDFGFEVSFLASERLDGTKHGQDAGSSAVDFVGGQSGFWHFADAGEECADRLVSAVGDSAYERGEARFGKPTCRIGSGVAAQESDGDVGGLAGERSDGAWEDPLGFGSQLAVQSDPGFDELLAGTVQRARNSGDIAVLAERAQPVSADEQERVVGVGLRAGCAVAAAEPLDLPRRDHDDAQVGVEQRFDKRGIAAFDRNGRDAKFGQPADQTGEALAGVRDLAACADAARVVDDADGLGLAGSVDACERVVSVGVLHPESPCCDDDNGTVGVGAPTEILIARRSNPRIPRAGHGSPAQREPRISCWSSTDKQPGRSPAGRRFIWEPHRTHRRDQSDTRMVHQ